MIDDGPILRPKDSSTKQHGISQEQFQAFRGNLQRQNLTQRALILINMYKDV